MARKKAKRYAAGDEIVVTGQRKAQPDAASDFMLERMMRQPVNGSMGSMGGGGGRRPITSNPLPAPAPASTSSAGPRITPTAISQPRSTLGTLTGTNPPRGYGVKMATRFKKGGSVSSASKRADGCATKGKTRGKLV